MKKMQQYIVFIVLFLLQEICFCLDAYKKFFIGEGDNLTQQQIQSRFEISSFQGYLEEIITFILIVFVGYLLYLRLKQRNHYLELSKQMMIYTLVTSMIMGIEVIIAGFTIEFIYIYLHLSFVITLLLLLDFLILKSKILLIHYKTESVYK